MRAFHVDQLTVLCIHEQQNVSILTLVWFEKCYFNWETTVGRQAERMRSWALPLKILNCKSGIRVTYLGTRHLYTFVSPGRHITQSSPERLEYLGKKDSKTAKQSFTLYFSGWIPIPPPTPQKKGKTKFPFCAKVLHLNKKLILFTFLFFFLPFVFFSLYQHKQFWKHWTNSSVALFYLELQLLVNNGPNQFTQFYV